MFIKFKLELIKKQEKLFMDISKVFFIEILIFLWNLKNSGKALEQEVRNVCKNVINSFSSSKCKICISNLKLESSGQFYIWLKN